jgi:ABC-type Fe3+-siderophore transport system permease subunit
MSGKQVPNTINWAAGLFVAFAVAMFVLLAATRTDTVPANESPLLVAIIVAVLILRAAWLLRKGSERARFAGIAFSTVVLFMSTLLFLAPVFMASDQSTLLEFGNLSALVTLAATWTGAVAAIVLLLHGNSKKFTAGEDDDRDAPAQGSYQDYREALRRGTPGGES